MIRTNAQMIRRRRSKMSKTYKLELTESEMVTLLQVVDGTHFMNSRHKIATPLKAIFKKLEKAYRE
jgi:hypothetical protein